MHTYVAVRVVVEWGRARRTDHQSCLQRKPRRILPCSTACMLAFVSRFARSTPYQSASRPHPVWLETRGHSRTRVDQLRRRRRERLRRRPEPALVLERRRPRDPRVRDPLSPAL